MYMETYYILWYTWPKRETHPIGIVSENRNMIIGIVFAKNVEEKQDRLLMKIMKSTAAAKTLKDNDCKRYRRIEKHVVKGAEWGHIQHVVVAQTFYRLYTNPRHKRDLYSLQSTTARSLFENMRYYRDKKRRRP